MMRSVQGTDQSTPVQSAPVSFAELISAFLKRYFHLFIAKKMFPKLLYCAVVACFLTMLNLAAAAPHVPASDDAVLERLPFRPNDPVAREMATLRTALRQNPKDEQAAVKLAQRYYGLVAEEGDPRYIGYAQAALAPWWSMAEPPLEVQLMRASLAQFNHDFSGSLRDLNSIITRYPTHPQARALRAIIHLVQARYDAARIDCRALHGITDELIAVGCDAMTDGLTGKADAALQTLAAEFARHPQATPDEKLWVLVRLAELAQRLGKIELAESYFKQAVALNISDTFLLAAYADLLLDQHRPDAVETLLKDRTRSDVLLLRLVFAEQTLKLPTSEQLARTLASRYAAAQLRGDTVHQQEEARFALAVEHDAAKALDLALKNWVVQREPRDARIVLEAALAAKQTAAAKQVIEWIVTSGIEDPTLLQLAQKIKGGA